MAWISKDSVFGKIIKYTPLGLFPGIAAMVKGSWADNLMKKLFGTGATDKTKEELELQDQYLDENREQEYALKEKWFNDYESPEAKVNQYKAAGLNPMMLANGGASVSASTAPQGQAPSVSSDGDGASVLSFLSEMIGMRAKIKDVMASASLKSTQSEAQSIQNRWIEKNNQIDYEIRQAELANLRGNLPKILADAAVAQTYAKFAPQLFESQVAQNNAGAQKALADADLARANVKLTDAEISELNAKTKVHQKELEQMDALIMKCHQECLTLASQAYLNDQMVSESEARVRKYDAQIEEIGTKIGLNKKEIEYYVWNHQIVTEVSVKSPIIGTTRTKVYSPEDVGYEPH